MANVEKNLGMLTTKNLNFITLQKLAQAVDLTPLCEHKASTATCTYLNAGITKNAPASIRLFRKVGIPVRGMLSSSAS